MADQEYKSIMDLIANPSLVVKLIFLKLYTSYRAPLRLCLIVLENKMLITREPINHKSAYRCLWIVPRNVRNSVFIPFNAKSIDGHVGLSKKIHLYPALLPLAWFVHLLQDNDLKLCGIPVGECCQFSCQEVGIYFLY